MREDRKEDNDMNRERRHRQRDDRDNQTGHDNYVTVQMETTINIVDIQIMKKTQVMNNQILTNHIIQTIQTTLAIDKFKLIIISLSKAPLSQRRFFTVVKASSKRQY